VFKCGYSPILKDGDGAGNRDIDLQNCPSFIIKKKYIEVLKQERVINS
jgi:hypothetical protein